MASSKCLKTGLQTVNMPLAGLGTLMANADLGEAAIDAALEAGVRLIDTATMYANEANIGKVITKWMKDGEQICQY